MPYKRYDITNTYSYRGRKKNENMVVKTIFLVLLPFIIIGVILGGAYISYLLVINDEVPFQVTPVATDDGAQINEDLLVVVNEASPLESTYVPELDSVEGVEVSKQLVDDLNHMLYAAKSDGIELKLVSGYVSFDQQQKLYDATFNKLKKEGKLSQIKAEAETKKLCPPAGCSESQTGLLLKFNSPENSDAYKWLINNSVAYGFVLRYPESKETDTGMTFNPNLFRYVGIESAANLRRYDMCLEEYATHISIR